MATIMKNEQCLGTDKGLVGYITKKTVSDCIAAQRTIATAIWVLTLTATIGFCLTTQAFSQTLSNRPELIVTEFAWTNAVNSDRHFDHKYVDSAPTAPIVFWTRIRATQEALDSLRQEGRFPIWHKWYVSCGATFRFDRSEDPIDAIDLRSAQREMLVQQLQVEVDNRGFFDWRTWSRKEAVSSCWYTIRVVDNRDSPLYCEELNDDCELTIKLGS